MFIIFVKPMAIELIYHLIKSNTYYIDKVPINDIQLVKTFKK